MTGCLETVIIYIDWYWSDNSSGVNACRLFPPIFQWFLILSEETSILQPRHTQLPLSRSSMQVPLLLVHIWAGILCSLSWQVVRSSNDSYIFLNSIPPSSQKGTFIACYFINHQSYHSLLSITVCMIHCTELMLLCGYLIAHVNAVFYLITIYGCSQVL